MAGKNKSIKKAKPEMNEEKIVGIAFGITIAIIAVFMLFSNISISPSAKTLSTSVTASFGEPGRLNNPFGLAVLGNKVYIASLNANEILKTSLTDKGWVIDKTWGGEGSKAGQFNQPSGLFADKDGNIYVADAYNNRIQKFDENGKYLSAIDLSKTGFWRPRNVMVDTAGIIYAANTGKYNVYRFNQEGQMVGDIVKFSGEVFGMAMDSTGRIFVANLGDRAVEVFDKNFMPVKKIKIASWIPNKGLWPMIAMDSKDRLYAVSELEKQVYVFDTKNKKFPITGVIKNDQNKKPLFEQPQGIAIDASDNIYVSDKLKNKVFKINFTVN